MFGLDIIGDLAKSVVDGVKDHYKGKREIKKATLRAKKELLKMETKAKIATQQAKIDIMLKNQDNDFKLDMIAMQNMNKSWKDEFILFVFMLPLIASFIPQTQIYVREGFKNMSYIPDFWIYLVVGMVVSIMGLRGLLRDFLNARNSKKFKKIIDVEQKPNTEKKDTKKSSYKPKHFTIEELVDKKTFENSIEEELWSLFDEGLLKDLDKLKEKFHNGTIVINNWKWGGNREWSGLRTEESPYYSKGSMHSQGKAFDLIFSDYSIEFVKEYIKTHIKEFPHIKGIEDKYKNEKGEYVKTTWLHIDTKDRGHLFFNA